MTEAREDPPDFKLKYAPDANEDGYVELPNVDPVKEITDGMAVNQAYSANVTVFNLLKTITYNKNHPERATPHKDNNKITVQSKMEECLMALPPFILCLHVRICRVA